MIPPGGVCPQCKRNIYLMKRNPIFYDTWRISKCPGCGYDLSLWPASRMYRVKV